MSDAEEKLTVEEREYVERKTQRRKTLGGTMHLKGCKVRMTGDRRKAPWSCQKPTTPAVTREQMKAFCRARNKLSTDAEAENFADCVTDFLETVSGATVAVDQWRPIETAPHTDHMRTVMVYWKCLGHARESYYDVDEEYEDRPKGWVSPAEGWRGVGDQCIPTNQHDATHWQPRPAPPIASGLLSKGEG
jgi:hypothetical protein